MAAGVAYEQLFRVPYVMKLIERIHAPGTTFSTYYGLGMTKPNPQRIMGRSGQYDIFEGTRSLSPMSSPGAPPNRINRKPVGTIPITVPRQYNSIGIEDEKIFASRTMGMNQSAPVNSGGQVYFAKQVQYLKTRMQNSLEFMAVRMFSGGFGMKPAGTGSNILNLCEFSDGSKVVGNPSNIPASNLTNAGGIIDVSWDNPSADIRSQLMTLNYQSARINGRTLTDVWVNATVGKYLFNNSTIQGTGGAVNKIFSTLQPAKEIAPNQVFPDTGVTVVFGGLPEFKFHIYNQGYVTPGTTEDITAQTGNNWTPYIPANSAIITPPPGEWCDMVVGSEPMRWNLLQGAAEIIYGFGFGTELTIDPPATDVKMLYNGAPVIVEPNAPYQLTVVF